MEFVKGVIRGVLDRWLCKPVDIKAIKQDILNGLNAEPEQDWKVSVNSRRRGARLVVKVSLKGPNDWLRWKAEARAVPVAFEEVR